MLPVPPDQLINQRISRSSLHPTVAPAPHYANRRAQGIFISNGWHAINATGIGRPVGTNTGDLQTPMMCPLPSTAFNLTALTPIKMAPVKLLFGGNVPTTAQVDEMYLTWGAAKARQRPFFAVCDGITCAVIAMLVATNSPLPHGTLVEWGSFTVNGVIGSGHAFTVVNRAVPSNPANPATWGNNCIVVDPWYTLQTGSATPAMYVNGANADGAYVTWLTTGTNIALVAEFHTGAYAYLQVGDAT
ncbi:hypothetical protein OG216_11455 [Streptomycetaceae bacterium NBC_01309]